MEYMGYYKNASRGHGNRLKDGNSRAVKSKRESSRQDLHFTNRNLNASDCEEDGENDVFYAAPTEAKPRLSTKKRRRSNRNEENKENEHRNKYEERLARLRKFKEERAKAKQNSVKKKPFMSVVPKNNMLDREYENNLFKKTEAELKKMGAKRKLLTPAAKLATPRVDTRRREPLLHAEETERPKRNILNLKTPASIKKAKPKVDTWRKEGVPTPAKDGSERKGQKRTVNTGTVTKTKTTKTTTVVTTRSKQTTSTAVSNNKKGTIGGLMAGSNGGFMRYNEVRSGQKSSKFNFKFANDGQMITSTNRKKKSLEKLFCSNAPEQPQLQRFSPKASYEDDDIFEGISPIDVDTPTPKKIVKDSDAFAVMKRETRRRSMIFTVEDIKPKEVKQEQQDAWEPQVITISDDDSAGEVVLKKELADEEIPQLNESFTIEVKEEKLIDRRPTIDETPPKINNSPKLIGSGRKSFSGRPSLIFVEETNGPRMPIPDLAGPQVITGRASLVFVEEQNDAPMMVTIEVFDSPKNTGVMSPSRRTPRMSFVEDDVPTTRPLPEGNLATVLLNKQQEPRRRSSGGSRRSSLVNFREEDQAPSDVREKVAFYYNLVEKELKRLQEMCDLYRDDADNEEIDENGKGLIIAAQGHTNILINKKLSKFKELVGHYERSWTDQKVRTDDLDGFWLMVSLDLENLDRRFEELRVLKENNWQEVVEQPKLKKLKCGGGIKKREKKPMKTKASGLADMIRKAREEAKKKMMMESALTETVTVVTPIKRSVRIATTPRRSSLTRNSICAGCTPVKSGGSKKSRKTIFNDHTLRRHEIVKSILKTPSEKRRAKSVLFLDSGLDTPEARRSDGSRKIIHTPKPKITFNEELEVEDVETISLTTPFKLDEEIRKRRRSSLFVKEQPEEQQQQQQPHEQESGCCQKSNRRRTLRFSTNATATATAEEELEQEEARDQISSPVAIENGRKDKKRRTTRGKSRARVSFV